MNYPVTQTQKNPAVYSEKNGKHGLKSCLLEKPKMTMSLLKTGWNEGVVDFVSN